MNVYKNIFLHNVKLKVFQIVIISALFRKYFENSLIFHNLNLYYKTKFMKKKNNIIIFRIKFVILIYR